MLKPSANIIDCPHSSRYSLVVAVAKRARQIAQEAEESGEILIQKPVELAVRDFVNHRCSIIEPDPNEIEEEEENAAEASTEEAASQEAEEAPAEETPAAEAQDTKEEEPLS